MNKTVLIIAGVVGIIILLVLIAAIIPRLKAAVSRTPLWGYLLLVIIVVGLLSFVAVQLFGPRGQDSLMSENIEGSEIGDADQDTPLEEKSEEKGTHFNMAKALEGNVSGDDTIYIKVSRDTVSIGATAFDSMEDYRSALDSMMTEMNGQRIILQDEYALASAFHEAKDALDDRGLKYSEKELE